MKLGAGEGEVSAHVWRRNVTWCLVTRSGLKDNRYEIDERGLSTTSPYRTVSSRWKIENITRLIHSVHTSRDSGFIHW